MARSLLTLVILTIAVAPVARSQEADPVPTKKDTTDSYANLFAGEFTPGSGYDIIKTQRGSLNISVYGLFRYMNQYPVGDSFTDHLGRVRHVERRNDLNWQRTFVWLTGFFYDPRFLYNITLWSLPTTQQTLLFGNLLYRASPAFNFGVGIGPNLTARSVQGQWPFFPGSDRQMAEEFFRGGFSSGFWITGFIVPRLAYTVSTNNNISQLGVSQFVDKPELTYSFDLRWQPTTGEFGPRNGFGDLEFHKKLATQLGFNIATAREDRAANEEAPPATTQIRLSDGVNAFETGALADGVTLQKLTYDYLSFDGGAKYRGWTFMGEYYFRWLTDFVANGPLPQSSLYDTGFMAELGRMVIPRTLNVYAATGYVWDQFDRHPWELSGGASFYPYRSRAWRLNAHYIHIVRSPTGSFFGYYTAGQTGTTISVGTDILF
ncbi:MAG TPA: hypothetical protein VH539_22520 [Gemmatimonadaceae bacterium]|jgi:hypothetical protein